MPKRNPVKKSTKPKEHPERRKCESELAKTIDDLLQTENLHELSRNSGIPQTTLSEWKNINIPAAVDRAGQLLEACGIHIILIDESEEDDDANE